jgi:hypothetical protein
MGWPSMAVMTNCPRTISGPSTYGVTTAPPFRSGAAGPTVPAGRSALISPPVARISRLAQALPRPPGPTPITLAMLFIVQHTQGASATARSGAPPPAEATAGEPALLG